MTMIPYAELQVTSNFSFLRGASHAEELVKRAARLGYKAIAITDRNSLAGVVRAYVAAKEAGLRLIVGARIELTDAPSLLAYPTDRAAYGRLSTLLTIGKRRAPKGECHLALEDVETHKEGLVLAVLPPVTLDPAFDKILADLRRRLGPFYLAAQHLYRGDDKARLRHLSQLAQSCRAPLLATNDVHYHAPERRALQDVLTCIREGCTIDQAGFRLMANAERHLKSSAEMARLFADHPDAIARTMDIVRRCTFSLDELRYDYPVEPCPPGLTPQAYLERETWAGAAEIYRGKIPDKVQTQLAHELDLIKTLGYAPYFLTVYDIVNYARSQKIFCQGRGSAANSAVCYVLGITAIDPIQSDLLFERFISTERNEPPDIDVDFEHERREEVIQYIYDKYTREHAGIAATVISYRGKSAIRDVGKAMGLSLDRVGALAKGLWGWRGAEGDTEQLYELGLDPREPRLAKAIELAGELEGFPRHLSQHVGGFVITKSPLHEMVPIENAAMKDRTFVEWDKDDLDALGILKIDVLALGMLTSIRKNLDLLRRHHGVDMELATIPTEDPATYEMLCQADSIGVFQVESRAQMSFLPRMKPRTFYDLVIEVAIVRPGPIQGDMVHPYLRRRNGEEKPDLPSPELEAVLGKTLGVPLFQEQAMKIAIVAGGFTPGEADGLRRAMATFRRNGTIHLYRAKMIEGMVQRGYELEFAERCFSQIEGFGEYGFPESHAASFALLAYISAWLKCHYPAAFCCALLNSQPMGFYAPAQLVRDARNHGVEVRPVDINRSNWDCSLEPDGSGHMALRLGFRQVKALREADITRLIEHRSVGYPTPESLWRRAGLDAATLECLADADCFSSMGLDRRQALWQVRGLGELPPPLFAAIEENITIEPDAHLPHMAAGEQVMADYRALHLSLKAHPVSFCRNELADRNIVSAVQLADIQDGRMVTVAGLVLVRQRPGTGNAIFVTLEDETGIVNVIVWPSIFDQFRKTMLQSRLLAVRGKLQRQDIVVHIIAESMFDHSALLASLSRPDGVPYVPYEAGQDRTVFPSRDFH